MTCHRLRYLIGLGAAVVVLSLPTVHAQEPGGQLANIDSDPANSRITRANSSPGAVNSAENVTNQSNNPATPQYQLILQNYFAPALQGESGRPADVELLRLYIPFNAFGVENIFRAYQPIETEPTAPTGRESGFGDTTIYDLALGKVHQFTFGGGPLLVLPVASHTHLGDGKWEAGLAGLAVTARSWGLVGTVVTYQHSFSGYGSSRPVAELVTVQPLIHRNLRRGSHLRSSGFWNLNYGTHVSEIPVGFGTGRVLECQGGTVLNFYLEPQYSVYQNGSGSPKWQILSAVTFLFPPHRRPAG